MRLVLLVVLVLGLLGSSWADDLDQLFDDPGADVVGVVSNPTPAPAVTAAPLAVSPIKVTGSAEVTAAVAAGQAEYGQPADFGGGFSVTGTLYFDARPDPRFRAWAVLSTTSTGVGFTTPALGEVFVDYTLGDNYLFRIGRQGMSWGQGKLLNPADLVSDVSTGLSVKLFTPVLGQSLTLLVFSKPGLVADPAKPSWRELVYAAQVTGDLGPFGWGMAGRARRGLDPLVWSDRTASAFLKTVVYGFDVYNEWLWDDNARSWHDGRLIPLYGLYWDRVDPVVKVQAETTSTASEVAVKTEVGPVKPGIQWTRYFGDGSGVVLAGLEWPVDGFTTLTFGLPVIYGSLLSEAYVANANAYVGTKRWLVGLKVTLASSF